MSSFVSKITNVEVLYFLLYSFTFHKFFILYQIKEVLSVGIVLAVFINIILSFYVLWRFRGISEFNTSSYQTIKKEFLFYTLPILALHVFNSWAMIKLAWFVFYRMLRYGF